MGWLAFVPHFFLPAEDAVILFQYSRNLAEHGAITFLAGGPHTEGATDFLWMVLVSGALKLGIPAFVFCAAVNVLTLIGLAVVLLKLAGVPLSATRIVAIAGGAALFPQLFAAASGFAVLPDALLLTSLVWMTIAGRTMAAAHVALALCLFRPDGVVFALPLLAYSLFVDDEAHNSQFITQTRIHRLVTIGTFFVFPGLAYFGWRWHYFGEFLPLPFLVKSDAERFLRLIVLRSARESFVYLLFVGVVVATLAYSGALVRSERRRTVWLFVSLVVVPTLFYWVVRLDQNVAKRFFYYLPLAAAILTAVNWPRAGQARWAILRTCILAWLFLLAKPFFREWQVFRDTQFAGVKQIAEDLGKTPAHGTILTTEAGFIPFFSGWQTYDAWGLNTAEFAHAFIQPQDVSRINPDLVVMHPDYPESCLRNNEWPAQGYSARTWPHLTRNLVLGTSTGQYELWLTSYGSESYRHRERWRFGQGDRECWFVRQTSPLHDEIVNVLQQTNAVGPAEASRLEAAHGTLKPIR